MGGFRGGFAGRPGFRGNGFYGRGFHGDFRAWRGGHWYHGFHGGNFGWWWTIGPAWYWYDYPIYPYPAYPVYASGPDYDEDYIPPDTLGPQPQQFWYRCDNPAGFYPYVTTCNGEWRQVPVEPEDLPDNGGPDDSNPPPPPDR